MNSSRSDFVFLSYLAIQNELFLFSLLKERLFDCRADIPLFYLYGQRGFHGCGMRKSQKERFCYSYAAAIPRFRVFWN